MRTKNLKVMLKQIDSRQIVPSEDLVVKTKERVLNQLRIPEYEEVDEVFEIPLNRKLRTGMIKFATLTAAVFVFMFAFLRLIPDKNTYAYIDVDLNPSFEMTIDSNYTIIHTKPFNNDAKVLLSDLDLENKSLVTAIEEVLKKSIEMNMIKRGTDNTILFSASLNDKVIKKNSDDFLKKEDDLNEILVNLSKKLSIDDDVAISTKTMIVPPGSYKNARENNMSMGRYSIYQEADKQGLKYTVEDARKGNLGELLEIFEASIDDKSTQNQSENTSSRGTATPAPENTQKVIIPTPVAKSTQETVVTTPTASSTLITASPTVTKKGSLENVTASPTPYVATPLETSSESLHEAFSKIEAEDYDFQSGIIKSECYDGGSFNGYQISPSDTGGYVVYNNVDFGSGAVSFECRVDGGKDGNFIEIRLDSLTGPLIGTCYISNTRYKGVYENFYSHVNKVKGVHNVYLKISNTNEQEFYLNWFRFGEGVSSNNSISNGSKIALKAVNGRYVSAENLWEWGLVAHSDKVGEWETFEIVDARNGNKALRSIANNKYVSVNENVENNPMFADKDSISELSSFDFIDLGNGSIALRCIGNNSFVSAEHEGKGPLIANRGCVGVWEIFEIVLI